jgi:hypothetical protein
MIRKTVLVRAKAYATQEVVVSVEEDATESDIGQLALEELKQHEDWYIEWVDVSDPEVVSINDQ